MSLTNEEKHKIYLEEKERLAKLEEEKLKNISPEEKQKIYREFMDNKVLFLDQNHIVQPNSSNAVIAVIGGIGLTIAFFIFGFSGIIIWVILYAVILAVLYRNKVLIPSPELKYSCPDCNHTHINFIREFEEQEMNTNGFIKAKCVKCNSDFKVVVDKEVLSSVVLR